MTSAVGRRLAAVLGSLLFLVVAPGFVAGLVPFWISRWQLHEPPLGLPALRAVGGILVAAGLLALLESFWRFADKGLGTPAPILPTQNLVVTGLFRFVRNPMYLAVTAMILGQALLFGSVNLLEYGAVVWIAFHLFVVLYEEPTLTGAYPNEYPAFREHVPRWIPRLFPWRAEQRPAA